MTTGARTRAEPSYSSDPSRLQLESWLVFAIVFGCLLVGLVAYAAYLMATAPIL